MMGQKQKLFTTARTGKECVNGDWGLITLPSTLFSNTLSLTGMFFPRDEGPGFKPMLNK
jgi:hypothetical protein